MSGSTVLPPRRVEIRRAPAVRKRALRATISLLTVLCVWQSAPFVVRAQTDSVESLLSRDVDPDAQMLLEATELEYDFDNDVVSAIGNVQIYYVGYTLEAEKVTLDRRKARLYAEGNVRLTEPDGNVVTTDAMELSDDFREGFAQQLRIDTIQRTRFIADSARREGGDKTVFENGTYTVYTRPTTPPDKPPLWQIRATRIIHNQRERTIYYKGARLEFWGVPIAYLPFLSHPDPTVRRHSGFLSPTTVYDDKLGLGVSVPYHWVLAPNMDVTFTATPLSKQGVLLDAMWRHRLATGSYSVSGYGIHQSAPENFAGSSGNRELRGLINTRGEFQLNSRWKWGWDLSRVTDRAFVKDYKVEGSDSDEITSQLYLTGQSERNRFDVRAYSFQITQEDYGSPTDPTNPSPAFTNVGRNLQEKQPVVHPVIDYTYVWDQPVVGGELSFAGNFTSLTRERTDAFCVTRVAGSCTVNRFRGVEGTFTRTTLSAQWRRTLIDPLGQAFTPFAYAKADLYFLASADPNVTTLTDEAFVFRGMPAVGVEYRYPFVATFNGGNQVIEPVAQLIVRPSEQRIGELPNEDAQSLIFDDTTLLDWDKFSGFDRSEGGTRLNLGLQYKATFDQAGFVSAMFGRSYQLAGTNSFATADVLNTAANSGLDSSQSDYISRIYFDSNMGLRLGARARFDEEDFTVQRAEIQAAGTRGPLTASLAYAFLAAKPAQGINTDREEIQAAGSLRLLTNWRLFGSMRYDLRNSTTVRDVIGLGYDDEGFSASLAYAEDRSRNDGNPVDQTIYLRVGLRTLGDTQISTDAKR